MGELVQKNAPSAKEGPVLLTEEPLTVVEEVIFDGVGGFVAVEDRKRGLIKAFAGDKIVRLSNGQGYVVPLEVTTATPLPPGTEILTMSERDKRAEDERFRQLRENEERLAKERQEEENRRLGVSTRDVKDESLFGVEGPKDKKK